MKSTNILFNWIPKSAGTSIFSFLDDKFGALKITSLSQVRNFKQQGCVTFGHLSYFHLRVLKLVQDSFHDNSFKFSFVRCPYSRSVSLYNYWISEKRMSSSVNFKEFMKAVHLKRPPIGLYNVVGLSQTNPQADWLVSGNGKTFVDKIYKLENLEEFTKDFAQKYNVEFEANKIFNKSPVYFTKKDLMKDSEAVGLVNMIYARDFHLLGYEMTK